MLNYSNRRSSKRVANEEPSASEVDVSNPQQRKLLAGSGKFGQAKVPRQSRDAPRSPRDAPRSPEWKLASKCPPFVSPAASEQQRNPCSSHVGHRIVHLASLVDSLDTNFLCKHCVLENRDSTIRTTLDTFVNYLRGVLPSNIDIEDLYRQYEQENESDDSTIQLCQPMQVTEHTIGIATSITCKCNAKEVDGHIQEHEFTLVEPERAEVFHDLQREGIRSKQVSSKWFSLNHRAVLGAHALGSGGDDLATLFGLLDLPGSTLRANFKRLETETGKIVRQVAKEAMNKALDQEIKLTLKAQGKDYDTWKASLPRSLNPEIDASIDMGWNTRSSGTRYASLSGFSFLVGCETRLVLLAEVLSKNCATCKQHQDSDGGIPPHDCPRNYEGSSKGMESRAGAILLTRMHDEKQIRIRNMISDDDSTIRAKCQHSFADQIATGEITAIPRLPDGRKAPDHGILPVRVNKPRRWLADPSHHTKVVGKHFFKLASGPRKTTKCTKLDALRLKRNFGYFQKQLRTKSFEIFRQGSKAVLAHHFNEHENCDPSWCHHAMPGNKEKTNSECKYRDSIEHAELKLQLKTIIDKFTTDEKLHEIHHSKDSQKNEALNKSVTKYAPKDREYSGTMSLETRILTAAAVCNIGLDDFYQQVFKGLGIQCKDLTAIDIRV